MDHVYPKVVKGEEEGHLAKATVLLLDSVGIGDLTSGKRLEEERERRSAGNGYHGKRQV